MSNHADLVRYCPNCGSIGEVGANFINCCPDGSDAKQIQKDLAEKLQRQFKSFINFYKESDNLKATNAELLEALDRLLQSQRNIKPPHSPLSDAEKFAMEVIAKAKGEQA